MLCIGGVGTDQTCSLDDTYGTPLVALPSLSSASTLKSSSSAATTVTIQPGSEFDSGVDVSFRANAAAAGGASSSSYSGFFEGIFGCLRPVWTVIGKATSTESKQKGICRQFCHCTDPQMTVESYYILTCVDFNSFIPFFTISVLPVVCRPQINDDDYYYYIRRSRGHQKIQNFLGFSCE